MHVHINIQRGPYICAICVYVYRRGNRRIWHFQFCSHCRVVEVIQSHGEHVTVYNRDSRNPHCRACVREKSPVTPLDTRGRIFIGSHIVSYANAISALTSHFFHLVGQKMLNLNSLTAPRYRSGLFTMRMCMSHYTCITLYINLVMYSVICNLIFRTRLLVSRFIYQN